MEHQIIYLKNSSFEDCPDSTEYYRVIYGPGLERKVSCVVAADGEDPDEDNWGVLINANDTVEDINHILATATPSTREEFILNFATFYHLSRYTVEELFKDDYQP